MNEYITVRTLLSENETDLKLKLVCSENGLNRKITTSEIHRPGLALSGFVELFTHDRVQILGNTEIRYLAALSSGALIRSIDRFMEFEIPAIIVTNNNPIPKPLIEAATRRYISIFSTPYSTTRLVHLLSEYLERKFAPTTSKHGSLVDVYGIGILFTGRSGIGKSEIALDLVERGHRLVADDLVVIRKEGESILIGCGREIGKHLLEIRGVGLIDVRRIFGIRGVRMQKRVEVEVHIVDWEKGKEYDRVGLEENMIKLLDVDLPQVILAINPGKNVTVIAETIAMNHLLKMYGHHTPREFNKRLKDYMKQKDIVPLDKDLDYIHRDYE
ncbi:MAG: HPr kinase/phosphorylase [Calditrichaceae bacterium]|nr:HPr kinase/phosphorylase [Calditrichaceae bacterium]MBN2708336.1 HPr kinase/phosphorylase [Calditrichaceae bacterium]RQV95225.1 MAG: HPr kinase/phosphorylase [Calditrichota bacterium]